MDDIAETYSVEAVLKATGVNQFGKAFQDATKDVQGIEKSSENAGISIKKLVGTIAGIAATVGIFRTLRSAVDMAFNRIDTMEQFTRVMTTMTGSAEEADDILGQINDTVKGTSYGLDVGASAVQNFVTSSMEVDKATETLAAWGDAVSFYGDGSNETFNSVTRALGQMTAKGKVQMDTMNMLTEAGIPAMQIFADATGKSVADVAEQMSKGEVDAGKFIDVMNEALANGTDNFGAIAGAAKEAGASWNGSFANMRAAVARGVTNIIGSIDTMLTENGLPDMRTMVANFGSSFEQALTKAGSMIGPLVDQLKEIYNAIQPWLPLIASVVAAFLTFNTTTSIINGVKNAVFGLRAGISLLYATMMANPVALVIAVLSGLAVMFVHLWKTSETFRTSVTNVFNTLLTFVMPIVQMVVNFIMTLWGQLVVWWQTNNQMILQAAQNVWNVISTVITTVMNVIWTIMQTLWPAIQLLVVTTWNAIQGVIQGAISIITGIIQAFSALFTGNWSALWNAIKQIVSGAVQFVWNFIQVSFVGRILKAGQALFTGLRSIMTSLWNTIKSLFTSGVNTARNVVNAGFNFIRNIISSVMNAISSIISSIWNAIRSIITSVLNGIKSTVTNVWNGIKNTISNTVNNIRNTVSNTFNSLKGIVTNAFTNVTSAVKNGMGNAYSAVKGKVKDFFNAGKNIVGSIADGIKENAKKVTNAISNVTQKIRDFLPFSPAKEGALRDIMNIQIPQSIAESIDKGRNVAVRSMAVLANAINGEMPTADIAGQINGIHARSQRQMNYDFTNEVNVNKQPIIIEIYDNKEAVRAYVNENNAVDAMIGRF